MFASRPLKALPSNALAFVVAAICLPLSTLAVGASRPAATAVRKAITLFVSKLGDNSDGRSWQKGFHSIQAALNAIPDNQGGHRVIIRPDTYIEANLYAAHKGAPGAYNRIEGDWDGNLGSGATGWVVIDSGDPKMGFKSYDWWSTLRAYKKGWSPEHTGESFSCTVWDRWSFGHLYVSGSDAGLFFDLVDTPQPFSVRVENCFSVGRAFGGGVAGSLSRKGEPSVFRRCKLWCLDAWGDAGGAYVRGHNPAPPQTPDAVFDDCTIVGPDNALQVGYPNFEGYSRVKFKNCRLIVLNFSQPHGKPATGVVYSDLKSKFLHVDLEDCTLMGYKVFGARDDDYFSFQLSGYTRLCAISTVGASWF